MLLRVLAALALALPATLAGQQAPRTATGSGGIALVRELAIGTDTAGPDCEFAGIGFAAVTRSGSVFVGNAPDGQIRKYDVLGRYRGDVGRIGSGPGEYRHAQGMAVAGDSLLVVYDWGNGRVVLFDTAGTYRRTFRVSGMGGGPGTFLVVLSDGSIGVLTRMAANAPRRAGAPPSAYVRYRLTGEILDTIRVPDEAPPDVVLGVRNLGWRIPFTATTVFTLLPGGGIATARTTAYRIDVAPASGPRFVIERSVPPVPLAGREREEWQALLRGRGPSLPRLKPFIRDLLADAEGRLWVEVYTQAVPREASTRAADRRANLPMQEPNAYDVFDDRGRSLGRVDLAPFSRLLAILDNRLWVSEETEEGSPVLVRFRMNVAPAR